MLVLKPQITTEEEIATEKEHIINEIKWRVHSDNSGVISDKSKMFNAGIPIIVSIHDIEVSYKAIS